MAAWIESLSDRPVVDVARALGIEERGRGSLGPCPACKAETRSESSRDDRRGPLGLARSGRGWKCYRCDVQGDSVTLAAIALLGAVPAKGDPRWRDLRLACVDRGLCDAWDPDEPRTQRRDPEPERPPVRPPLVEVEALWDASNPVDSGDPGDADARAFLEGRSYGPLAELAALDLVRVTPPERTHAWPWWWPSIWSKTWRLVTRAYEPDGRLASVHARAVIGTDRGKTRWPLGRRADQAAIECEARGLLFADRGGVRLLRGEAPADVRVVIGEGLTGLVNAALQLRSYGEKVAILTGANGSFHALKDVRWPEKATVYVCTDDRDKDGTGEKYARQVRAAIPARVVVRRVLWNEGQPEGSRRDMGDATRDAFVERMKAAREVGEPAAPPPQSNGNTPDPDAVDGIAELRALVAKLRAAQDGEEQGKAIAAFLEGGAIKALVATHAEVGPSILACLAQIRKIRGLSEDAKAIERAIREAVAASKAEQERPARAPGVVELLRDSLGRVADESVPDDLVLPAEYEVRPDGVWRVTLTNNDEQRSTLVCHRPLYIGAIAVDVDGAGASVELRWHDGVRWRSRNVPRNTALVARSLAEESLHDVPVSSASAGDVVRYLEAWLAVNATHLPPRRTSATLGWRSEGFLWGDVVIGPDGPVDDAGIGFALDDPGSRQVVAGYRASGTWEGWLEAIVPACRHPRIALALLTALAAPLLRHLPDAPNFIVDFAGETSQGKTTSLRVGASVWGSPSERAGGIVWSWDTTLTWLERAAALASDLPIFVDDSKRAQPWMVEKIVMGIAQGRGKGRAAVKGLQAFTTSYNTMESTGEAPLTSYTTAGGASARVLTLWGSPFGGQSTDAAKLARDVTLGVLEHHGHAGPRLVQWLQQPDSIECVRRWYREARDRCAQYSNGNAVFERASAYFAVLDTAQLVAEEIGIPELGKGPMSEAWKAMLGSSEDADKATAALRDAYAWASVNQSSFWGRHPETRFGNTRTPNGGWLGAWDSADDWAHLAFQPTTLKEQMTGWGYDHDAIVKTWADRGWLRRDGKSLKFQARIEGMKLRLFALTREAINAAI